MTCRQVAEVEDVVNEKIKKSLPVCAFVAPLEQVKITFEIALCVVFVVVDRGGGVCFVSFKTFGRSGRQHIETLAVVHVLKWNRDATLIVASEVCVLSYDAHSFQYLSKRVVTFCS